MSSEPDEKHLTAWERWELASFDAPSADATRNKANAGAGAAAGVATAAAAAVDEVERLRQQAQEAGRAAGYAAGYAEGQTKGRAEAARFAGMVTQLDSALNEFDQQVSEDLLALAIDVARQVVRQSIAVKPELLLEILRQALMQMPHPHTTISINPEDASLVRAYLGDQLAHAGHRLHEDPRVERGGCTVEASGSQIDASIATRWRRIVESLGSNAEWLQTEDASASVTDSNGNENRDSDNPA